jgi:hypothetical protein
MKKAENAILGARTPEAYIEASLASKLSPQEKVRLARVWMRSSGYSADDILKARNRHPFWKAKKAEGAAERTKKRQAEHDYSNGVELVWTASLIGEFIGMNGKDETGRYQNKDWQMAKRFRTTIPSIQYMRRRLALAKRSLGARAGHAEIMEFLGHGKAASPAAATKQLPVSKPAPSLTKKDSKPASKNGTLAAAPIAGSGAKRKAAPSAVSSPKPKAAFGVKPVSGRKPTIRPKNDEAETFAMVPGKGKAFRKRSNAVGKPASDDRANARRTKPGESKPGQSRPGLKGKYDAKRVPGAKVPAKSYSAGRASAMKKIVRTTRNDPQKRGSGPGSRPGSGKPRRQS